jgi:hypothetical protein
MDGKMNLDVRLRVPGGTGKEAEGKIVVSCPSCTIGDGIAKIKPRPRPGARAAFAGEGLTVPTLDLGDFGGQIDIARGKGVIKRFSGVSRDGELVLVGEMQFGRRLTETTFPGCVRFKVSDELKQREREFGNIQMVMGTPIDAEGYSNLRTKGKIGELRYLPAASCENGGEPLDDGIGTTIRRSARPAVVVPPPDEPRPDVIREPGSPDAATARVETPILSPPPVPASTDERAIGEQPETRGRRAVDDVGAVDPPIPTEAIAPIEPPGEPPIEPPGEPPPELDDPTAPPPEPMDDQPPAEPPPE